MAEDLFKTMRDAAERMVYEEAGKAIREFLDALECPKCKRMSNLDWKLRKYSEVPSFVCLTCKTLYPITGLRFKNGNRNKEKLE